jgi:hypothetical protein
MFNAMFMTLRQRRDALASVLDQLNLNKPILKDCEELQPVRFSDKESDVCKGLLVYTSKILCQPLACSYFYMGKGLLAVKHVGSRCAEYVGAAQVFPNDIERVTRALADIEQHPEDDQAAA